MIDRERIRALLLGAGVQAEVDVRAVTGSTNDDAKAAANLGVPAPALFVADAQTSGRGREGHDWLSRSGDGLLMSVLMRPSALSASSSAPLTLAIGVAIAEALESNSSLRVGLKWPNDLLVDDKKIAGILVEAQIRGDRITSIVVGVGLNVHGTSFPPVIASIATSLALVGIAPRDRSELAAKLTVSILHAARRFEDEGLAPVLDGLRARDVLLGAPVRVGDLVGVGDGIDETGRLLVRTADGECIPIASGHVEPRALVPPGQRP